MENLIEFLGLKGNVEWTIILKAILVYLLILLMIRLGNKRILGRLSPFDIILAIILGSIASRAITGHAPLVPSLAAVAVMVLIHWIASYAALKNRMISKLIKGRPKILIKDGILQGKTMKKSHIGKEDLISLAHEKGAQGLDDVQNAYLEDNGDISIIRKRAYEIEVSVEKGVKVMKIYID